MGQNERFNLGALKTEKEKTLVLTTWYLGGETFRANLASINKAFRILLQ